MYPAVKEQDISFRLIHDKDGSPIGYQKVCKAEGVPVPDDEIIKGYEVDEGEYVEMTEEDFEAAEERGYRAITLLDFVPRDQIDPVYFEGTYYLGPDEGAERVYALLARALEDSGLAAIGRYVFRDREQLGCLRVRDGVIILEKMHFADEIRPTKGIVPRGTDVADKELAIARDLIDRFAGDFDPKKYEDVYREKLLAVVRAKRRGKPIRRTEPEEPQAPADLMEALRESLATTKRRRTRPRTSSRRSSGGTRRAKARKR
jgi:DNA end-binding protein Ku